jgi:hypothetical protein
VTGAEEIAEDVRLVSGNLSAAKRKLGADLQFADTAPFSWKTYVRYSKDTITRDDLKPTNPQAASDDLESRVIRYVNLLLWGNALSTFLLMEVSGYWRILPYTILATNPLIAIPMCFWVPKKYQPLYWGEILLEKLPNYRELRKLMDMKYKKTDSYQGSTVEGVVGVPENIRSLFKFAKDHIPEGLMPSFCAKMRSHDLRELFVNEVERQEHSADQQPAEAAKTVDPRVRVARAEA